MRFILMSEGETVPGIPTSTAPTLMRSWLTSAQPGPLITQSLKRSKTRELS